MDESEKLDVGLYKYVDEESGYIVYYSVFDGELNSVSAVPIKD